MEFVNELNVFKDIIADLSGVSVYLMALYVFTKAMAVFAWVFLGTKVINAVSGFFKSEVTKEEARNLDDENYCLKRELREVKANAEMEVKEIKSLYKILKEASRAKGESK